MTGPGVLQHGWWLASRASGMTAFLAVSLSVALGLAMATKILHGRVKAPALMKLHERLALVGLVAIAVHAITLLVYVLGVIHALGGGTDASTPWMRAILLATGAPILLLALLRWLPGAPARPRPARARLDASRLR